MTQPHNNPEPQMLTFLSKLFFYRMTKKMLTITYACIKCMHIYYWPTFINALVPIHCPVSMSVFIVTASILIMKLIFEILTNTPIISELHPSFLACLCHESNIFVYKGM